MQNDSIAAAHAMLAANRPADAVALIDRSATLGNASALFQQALWRLAGSPVPRDLPLARAILRRAATLGHEEAQMVEIALTANGSGAPPDWQEARRLLHKAAKTVGVAQQLLAVLDAMRLAEDGTPLFRSHQVRLTPDASIERIPAFLTPAECAHIARCVTDILAPAVVVDPRTGRSVPHPIRSSDAAVIGPTREDMIVRAINQRIATVSNTDIEQGEALTVLRYATGQQYRLHTDVLPGSGNQRVKTLLIYLNDAYDGGQTVFPYYNLTIAPKAGDAILFNNTLEHGRVDSRSQHAGLPVIRGVKWLATRWIRARSFNVWRGPEM